MFALCATLAHTHFALSSCRVVSRAVNAQALVTEHGRVGDGKYLDPRSGQSFAFDHLRKAVSDVAAADVDDAGGFRGPFEKAVTEYTSDHYEKGCCSVRPSLVRLAAFFFFCFFCITCTLCFVLVHHRRVAVGHNSRHCIEQHVLARRNNSLAMLFLHCKPLMHTHTHTHTHASAFVCAGVRQG
jgi:hypothetical protein